MSYIKRNSLEETKAKYVLLKKDIKLLQDEIDKEQDKYTDALIFKYINDNNIINEDGSVPVFYEDIQSNDTANKILKYISDKIEEHPKQKELEQLKMDFRITERELYGYSLNFINQNKKLIGSLEAEIIKYGIRRSVVHRTKIIELICFS